MQSIGFDITWTYVMAQAFPFVEKEVMDDGV